MTQPYPIANLMVTTMGQLQDPVRTAPSAEAVSRFQALMQQADTAAPTGEAQDGPSMLGQIVGTHDVQMDQLFKEMDTLQRHEGPLTPQEVALQVTELLPKIAQAQMETTIAGAFSTATKGSLETLLKNQ
ncbi:type III secretion protein SctI [Mycetohabitans endofungorum]|uniref:type III secretion protein SctI n=1 Tax=Mycetohabitans endofungorum TaxID=417203 RepID=UPI002B05C697|nr:type III secretion protein SctI [Mycetohabitans endofungorum]